MMTFIIPFAASGADEAASVFPPLDTWHFPSQIFWTLLLFAFLYFMLSRFILPKLGSTIETRQSTLADDLDDAQRFSDEADSAQKALEVRMAEARSKARETADAARAKIDAELAAQTAKVDADINAKLEAAETRITDLRTAAMSNVAEIATDTVQAMTERLGVKTTKTAAKSAVGSVLKG